MELSLSSLNASSRCPLPCMKSRSGHRRPHGQTVAALVAAVSRNAPSIALPPRLAHAALPKHIAIIMDGNARWAAQRGLSTLQGHQAGLEAFKAMVTLCHDWGIQALTVFAFSSDNWRRSDAEVALLMALFTRALRAEGDALHDRGVRFRGIGDAGRLPAQLRHEIDRLERLTVDNEGMQLSVAMSYSGRSDIAAAARSIARLAAAGLLDPEQVDEAEFERHLSLAPVLRGVGPPDLLIRTSGEARLSNFLLWELAHAELVFCPAMWPDFDAGRMEEALVEFQRRARRFGGRGGQQQPMMGGGGGGVKIDTDRSVFLGR